MDATELSTGSPISESGRDAVLVALLREHPGALVSAIDADGLFVELPASLELSGHQVVEARSALAVVEASSRRAIIDAWDRAKANGGSYASVVLDNGVPASYYFVDVRHRHGVFMGVVVAAPEAQSELASAFAGRAPVLPKTGRIDKDEMAMILAADDRICRILGYDAAELVGTRSLELIHPDDQDRAVDAWMEMLAMPGDATRLRARHVRKDGSSLWMELTNANLLGEADGRVVTEMIDISDEMAALEEVRQREQLLGRLTDALPSGVLHVDLDRRVLYTNARLHRVVGTEPAETVGDQLRTVVVDDQPAVEQALDGVLVDGRDADLEVRLRLPGDTRDRRCRVACRVLTDAAGDPAGAVICIDDETEASELRVELQRRATVDELTGCLNRAAVLDALESTLRGHATGTAVVFLDLDGLKQVNDTYGHRAGDQLLAGVARRLRGALREGDVIGRLGGDEFIVMLCDVTSGSEAMRIGARLAGVLAATPEPVAGRPMNIRTSIGVAWANGEGVVADVLIAAADRAMYRSKRDGDCEIVYGSV